MRVFDEAAPTPHPGKGSSGSPINSNSKSASVLNGFISTNKQLQENIAALTRQNQELKQLERLRPQLLELQSRISSLQDESFRVRSKAAEDIAALTDRNQELTLQLKTAGRALDSIGRELAEAKQFAEASTQRCEQLAERERQLMKEAEHLRRVAREAEERSVDPAKYEEVLNQLAEATGDRSIDDNNNNNSLPTLFGI